MLKRASHLTAAIILHFIVIVVVKMLDSLSIGSGTSDRIVVDCFENKLCEVLNDSSIKSLKQDELNVLMLINTITCLWKQTSRPVDNGIFASSFFRWSWYSSKCCTFGQRTEMTESRLRLEMLRRESKVGNIAGPSVYPIEYVWAWIEIHNWSHCKKHHDYQLHAKLQLCANYLMIITGRQTERSKWDRTSAMNTLAILHIMN